MIEQLQAALGGSGGGAITLPPGHYGHLGVKGGGDRDAPLVVRSADPGDPAVFSSMWLRDCRSVVFQGVTVDYEFRPSDDTWSKSVDLSRCSDVRFEACVISGDTAHGKEPFENGYPWGYGIAARHCEGLRVSGCRIDTFVRGITAHSCKATSIADNDISRMRSDGMSLSDCADLTVARNQLHGFLISPETGDHADFIQIFVTARSGPSSGVVIEGNTIDATNGEVIHAIKIGNNQVPVGGGLHKDVSVTGNMIAAMHAHGVNIEGTEGLVVAGNQIYQARRSAVDWHTPTIAVDDASSGVVVGNTGPDVPRSRDGLVVAGNSLRTIGRDYRTRLKTEILEVSR